MSFYSANPLDGPENSSSPASVESARNGPAGRVDWPELSIPPAMHLGFPSSLGDLQIAVWLFRPDAPEPPRTLWAEQNNINNWRTYSFYGDQYTSHQHAHRVNSTTRFQSTTLESQKFRTHAESYHIKIKNKQSLCPECFETWNWNKGDGSCLVCSLNGNIQEYVKSKMFYWKQHVSYNSKYILK